MSIQANLKEVLSELPTGVRLVAVSKFHPNEGIGRSVCCRPAYFRWEPRAGNDSEIWNPAQRHWMAFHRPPANKQSKIHGPYVAMIHAIDSYKLLVEVNKQASKVHRVIPCLLQIHIAQEETKFGFSFDECREMLDTGGWKDLKNVRLSGVMGMATNVDDDEQIKREFCSLNTFFKENQAELFFWFRILQKKFPWVCQHDYPLAVEAGSTLVRVGSKIFGERNY